MKNDNDHLVVKFFFKNKQPTQHPIFFRIYALFEADNEKDNSSIGIETINIHKQNPVSTGYQIISELEDVLKSYYYKSLLGYDNVDWFVNEVMNIENKMAFFFNETKKDIIKPQEDEEEYRNNNICPFCEKN